MAFTHFFGFRPLLWLSPTFMAFTTFLTAPAVAGVVRGLGDAEKGDVTVGGGEGEGGREAGRERGMAEEVLKLAMEMLADGTGARQLLQVPLKSPI